MPKQPPTLRIRCSYRGQTRVLESSDLPAVAGRSSPSEAVSLDLTPDRAVSRRHALIGCEDGQFWIEDLDSACGTQVSGSEIKGKGKWPLQEGEAVQVGETILTIEPCVSVLPMNHGTAEPRGELADSLDANLTVFARSISNTGKAKHILEALYELPLQFAAETRFDLLLQKIVSRLSELIPQATSACLLLKDPDRDVLLLKAYHSRTRPVVSETLARRAMAEHRAFLWVRSPESIVSGSIVQERIHTGIYAPLLWQGEALGAVCVDNSSCDDCFSEDDLRLLVVVAQYGAMAVAGNQLQEKLRRESVTKANLLRQFSPWVAERLLSRSGRLRLGGERSEATILWSDIRGFTKLSRDMEPDDIVEMLNEYFGQLVPIIRKHQGMVDKYMGDAILAIFGSPEPDPEHHIHAIQAAAAMQAAVAKLNAELQARGAPNREVGIGVHCGDVVHGFVGTSERMEFTVVSEAVNRASRFCQAAAGGEVLLSPAMYERAWKILEAERISIPTKHEGPLLAYRLRHLK
jgi:adenylate cyclase